MNVTKLQQQFEECLKNILLPLEAVIENVQDKMVSTIFYEHIINSLESLRIATKDDGSMDVVVVVSYHNGTRISLTSFDELPLDKVILYAPFALEFLRSIDNGTYASQSKNV